MSLANTAVLLNSWGHKVLIIDWDLEAPGLEHFYKPFIDLNLVNEKIGIIDLLEAKDKLSWQDGLVSININNANEPIHMLTSGKRDEEYFRKVRKFNIDEFYQQGGGIFIEKLRDEWKENYDFVLIDSRTGITEIGGICTVQLPDHVVLLFTATDQGFEGTLDVANRALKAQQRLPFDRLKLIFIPILTKFDTKAEFKLSQKWIDFFATNLAGIYDDWLPVSIKRDEFIQLTKVPYITYFSFGEKLPVLEQSLSDTSGLAYSYENIASLLANNLTDVDLFFVSRDKFISQSKKNYFIINEFNETNSKPKVKVFISYSKSDEAIKNELMSHMSILTKKHNVSIWTDDYLLPGDKWNEVINKNLGESDIVLALVSSNYLKSKYIRDEVDKYISLNKRIIPILVERPEDFYKSSLSNFIGLPRNGTSIADSDYDRSQIFADITDEIERVLVNTLGQN